MVPPLGYIRSRSLNTLSTRGSSCTKSDKVWQKMRPIIYMCEVLKWRLLKTPLFGPRNEASKVYELTKLNSLCITTLPQVSLDFYIAKQQS